MENLLEKFQEFGLSSKEAEVYLALLSKKELTGPEIGKITSVSRSKSYEVVQSLVKKGLCKESYRNGTKTFSSIEPQLALNNILASYEAEINNQKKILERKKEVAKKFQVELTELQKKQDLNNYPIDYIEILTDVSQIRKRWIDLQSNAMFEMLSFNKPPYALSYDEGVSHQEDLIKQKKIKLAGLYEYGDFCKPDSAEYFAAVESFTRTGEECRIAKKLPMKLVIVDEKIVMLALNDPVSMQPSITTIIVEHPDFALAQKRTFESYWNEALPFEEINRLSNT